VDDVVRSRRSLDQPQPYLAAAASAAVLLLLVAFMLAAHRPEVDQASLTLPGAVTRDPVPPGAALVSIDRGGVVRVTDGSGPAIPVAGVDDVQRFAAAVMMRDATRAFAVKADQATPYGRVDGVIRALRRSEVASIYLLCTVRAIDDET
jgi:biopolymer transport protein ExbD